MGIGYLAVGSVSFFMAIVPSETIPPTHVATALGFIMGVWELAGGFAGPALAGIASETAPRVLERHKRMIVSSPA